MRKRWILATLTLVLTPAPALAQPLFGNPFADAAAYRRERGELTEAHYRVRFEATRVERGGAPLVSEFVIDAAADWALAREGQRATLYDFRLNRVFMLGAESFTTANGMGPLVFRVMERQNRSYLQRVLAAAGARDELPDACDAESELGLVIPGAQDAGTTEIRERPGVFTLRCANREIGGFTTGDGEAAPAAFWPTMYAEMTTHPALHRRVRESGLAPARMEISFREGTGGLSRRNWRLIAVETVAIPYPLTESLGNETSSALDALAPGMGQVAAEAVAGRALGGPPTLESWDRHMRDLARSDGDAAAGMLFNPMSNMFPELSCQGEQQLFVCGLVRRFRSLADPAPMAVIEVSMAEQRGDAAAAIAAMQRAQTSAHRDHPALGASFALALLRFDAEYLAQARAANLPTDIAALQNRAVMAFPYNPAYWTDVGDRFGVNYEWPSAFMFYDVAYSLPMPGAVANNPALVGKREQMERIRRDFPDAFVATSAPARP
jgi:hypothetical protein